jgi:hypothetical protein
MVRIVMLHFFVRFVPGSCAIALLATLAACGASGKLTAGGSVSSGSAIATGTSIPTDAKEALVQGFHRLASTSFRLRESTKMSGPGGTSATTRIAEFAPPDRRHAFMEGYETISVGEDHYEKVNGTWSRMSQGGKRDLTKRDGANPFAKAIEEGTMAVTDLGTDQLDGKPAHVYQIAGAVKFGETSIKGQYKVWLSATDGLPLKTEGKTEPPYIIETVLIYEYDPNIRIEAPLP